MFKKKMYIYHINNIIVQMNNIINQMNSPMTNQMNNLINQMNNNMTNFNNQINYNNNYFMERNNNTIKNPEGLINIVFNNNNHFINLIVKKDQTINELINNYLIKIQREDLINNYKNNFFFLYNHDRLEKLSEKKIGKILKDGNEITVVEKKILMAP